MLVPYQIMQYYVITIFKTVEQLESESDLQSLKYLLNHCSSSVTSVPNFASGHPYPDFVAT